VAPDHIYIVIRVLISETDISPATQEHIQVKYTLLPLEFEKLEAERGILFKTYNIKFQKNSSSGSRVVPCGRTDGQTCRNSRVPFVNLAKALGIGSVWLMTGICGVPCVKINETSGFMK